MLPLKLRRVVLKLAVLVLWLIAVAFGVIALMSATCWAQYVVLPFREPLQ